MHYHYRRYPPCAQSHPFVLLYIKIPPKRAPVNAVFITIQDKRMSDFLSYSSLSVSRQPLDVKAHKASFLKTDPDGTFVRRKKDAMLNGRLKPAYILQHGVDSEYITWPPLFYISKNLKFSSLVNTGILSIGASAVTHRPPSYTLPSKREYQVSSFGRYTFRL